MKKFLLALSIFCSTQAFGEIETVRVRWTQGTCKGSCVRLVDHQFQRIPGVAEVEVNENAAIATLKWKPNQPFNYRQVEAAMSMVGLDIEVITVAVRGTIVQAGQNFRIVSVGDNTSFNLLGTLTPEMSQQVIQFNAENLTLSTSQKEQLLQGMEKHEVARIEGPLFMPERSPPDPYRLIISSLRFIPKEEKSKQSY